nr:hypothetical protein [Bacilli bacterium]
MIRLRKKALWSLFLFAWLLSGCALGQIATSTNQVVSHGSVQVVSVIAKNYSWTLSRRKFVFGEPIRFVVKSIQGVHGFSILGTNISNAVSQGEPSVTVDFTPKQKGVYTIKCNVYCGSGHDKMVTTFTVV